jgi:hypothetical protein
MNKLKLVLLLFPIFCFASFKDNFSLVIDYYKNLLSNKNEIKIIFPKDYKKDLKKAIINDKEMLFLFFPKNCGLDLLLKDKSFFEDIKSVRSFIESLGCKITHFQIISEVAVFKNLNEINNFYLKFFDQKIDLNLLESRFLNHNEDYFFPIKFCSIKLKKQNSN